MENLYKKYIKTEFDEQNRLVKCDIICPENFNFGYDVVDEIANHEPDRRAMFWINEQEEQRTFTFSDISKYSNKTANMLLSLGIKKGDRVMIILKRHYEFWFTIIALHKIGAVAIPATNLLTVKDIVYRVKSANISGIVCTNDGDIKSYVNTACEECDTVKTKVLVGGEYEGFVNFNANMLNQPDTLERIPTLASEDMLLYFTSGTTGNPKMVVHQHGYAIAHIQTAKFWHNCIPSGLHLTLSDTGWGKAVWGKLYGQWFTASGIFVYDFDKFNPLKLLEFIEKYKITTFCAPPTVYRFFIKEGMSGFDLSSLTHVSVAGEALNEEVFNKFYEYTGLKLMEGFGQTESTLLIATLVNMEPKPGSMGKPTPIYDVRIVDDNCNEVEDGEVGEIVVVPNQNTTGAGLFRCYLNDDNLNKKAWEMGVYHTGDTAYKDEDGYLWYVGRTDDIIKASGYRIGPFEVESVLMEHPAVLECAVTGAPDPVRGQVVKATVVVTSSYTPSDELAKELQDYVKKTTAPYKYPRIVEFVDAMPKTISGKIKRAEIRNS